MLEGGCYALSYSSHLLTGSATIRRWGFVGMSEALLGEVCHCVGGFEVSYAQDTTNVSVYFLLPVRCLQK